MDWKLDEVPLNQQAEWRGLNGQGFQAKFIISLTGPALSQIL